MEPEATGLKMEEADDNIVVFAENQDVIADIIIPPEPVVKPPVRKRGKAIAWKFVKTYANMDMAMEQYSKSKLLENGMIRGRKSFGKANAIYYNCQKMNCGCMKKWRLLVSPLAPEVVEEVTYEDHSKHEFFARNGGFGMSFDQVQITEEALSRYPMKPLQIFNHFSVLAAEALARDPQAVVVAAPKIAQIVSYVSFQKKKKLTAVREMEAPLH